MKHKIFEGDHGSNNECCIMWTQENLGREKKIEGMRVNAKQKQTRGKWLGVRKLGEMLRHLKYSGNTRRSQETGRNMGTVPIVTLCETLIYMLDSLKFICLKILQ